MGWPGSSRFAAPAAQVGRGRRLLSRLLGLCSWLYLAVALGLWALLRWADLWWPASVFLFAPRWLCALPLLVLLPAAWLLLRPRLLVPLGLAAVVVAGPVTGLCVPWHNLLSPEPTGPRLRVLTCNLHGSTAVDPRALEDFVLASNADVVALQEWPEASKSSLRAWPGWHYHVSSGLFLASQFPIRGVTELGHDSYGPKGLVTRYDLETPAGVVHFFSLHLASPRDALSEEVHEKSRGPEDVQKNSDRRWQQSEYVAGFAAECDGPVLLAGDFNTPPESAIFRQVWVDYADAFGAAGWGWGYTFHGGRTWVRIDHVLMGKGWHCRHCRVGPHVGSPHRPVLAELTWTGAPAEEPTARVRGGAGAGGR